MAQVSTNAAVRSRVADPRPALSSGRIGCDFSSGSLPGVVVLVHGNSSDRRIFAAQEVALLAAGWGVLALDLPGHGGSDDARDPHAAYSFPGYAAAVSELIDLFDLRDVHLVGWSLGGHVAFELAATDPRVRSVLVTGTPPVKPSLEALRDAFTDTPDMDLASREAFSRADAAAYVGAMLDCPGAAPETMIGAAQRTDGRARKMMVESAVSGVGIDQAAFVASAQIPVAILQGRRDPFLRAGYFERFAEDQLWRGDVQWFDDLGHAPHWRAPKRFNALMLAFLAEVQGGAR